MRYIIVLVGMLLVAQVGLAYIVEAPYALQLHSQSNGATGESMLANTPDTEIYRVGTEDVLLSRLAPLSRAISYPYYDREAVAGYADLYWDIYNPDYADYSASGGDCANYVSQCMIAGGLSLWQGNDGAGYGVDAYGAMPFCDYLHDHLVNYEDVTYSYIEYSGTPPSDLTTGDVIIYGTAGGDLWQHAVIVVGGSGDTCIIDSHTTDRYHEPWDYAFPDSFDCVNFYHIADGAVSEYTQFKITASALNVRVGPSTSYDAITQVNLDEEYVAYNSYVTSGTKWWNFWVDGRNAWCSSNYTELVNGNTMLKVNVDGYLNVRDGPGTTYSIVDKIFDGQVFVGSATASGDGYEWWNFCCDGRSDTWCASSFTAIVNTSLSGKKLCIDPGHGGTDPGAEGPTGYTEKEANLDMALRLRDLLEADGAIVYLTRATDTTVSLADRVAVANDNGTDLFCSIHCNAFDGTVQGTETYYHSTLPADSYAARSAGYTQDELVAHLARPDRGVKQADFYVLRETTMPATLTEVAFIDNAEEEALLKDPDFRQDATLAMYHAICTYFGAPAQDAAPVVEITAPDDGSALRGAVSITANVTDDNGIGWVRMKIDDGVWQWDSTPPHEWAWDTSTVTDGLHTIFVEANDTVDQRTNASIEVLVHNADDPLAYWPLDEGSGQVIYDNASYGNDGALGTTTATEAVDPNWALGKASYALAFDGTDDYATVNTSPSLNLTGAISIEVWLTPSALDGFSPLLVKDEAYLLRIDDAAEGSDFTFFIHDGTSWEPRANSGVVPTTDEWYHVVGTYDGVEIKLYVNSVLKGQSSRSGTLATNSEPLLLGGWLTERFAGVIDEVKIYNRALSASEINQSYDNFTRLRSFAAWTVYWDSTSRTSFETHVDMFDEVSPFWYDANADGSITPLSGAGDATFVDFAHNHSVKVLPLISNEYDKDLVHVIISDPVTMQNHITNITELVRTDNYDGIDIDYEGLYASDEANFTEFIRQLSIALHDMNRYVSVTVQAKWSDACTWDGPGALNYSALSEHADKMRIMAYPEHWSTSEPGPIASIDWVEDIVSYAVTKCADDKIMLGVPWYGRDWYQNADLSWSSTAYTYTGILDLMSAEGATRQWDSAAKVPYFNYYDYQGDGKDHYVYYEDNESLSHKLDLVRRYNLSGVCIWRLGQEDDDNWAVMALKCSAGKSATQRLKKGWNLITLPLNTTYQNAEALACSIENCVKVARWDGSSFTVHTADTIENDFALEQGVAYLVFVTEAADARLMGTALSQTTHSLAAGWNAIGRFNFTTTDAETLGGSITNCTALAYWDHLRSRFVVHKAGSNINNFDVERGTGLLAYVTSASEWTNV